jgi:DNA-binding transcriptional MocR family regulator
LYYTKQMKIDAIHRQIADRLEARTGPALAATIGAMAANGSLSVGDQLPTVRALASELGISPSTVAEAWRILRDRGVIETDRRRGTTIRHPAPTDGGRYWHVPVEPGTLDIDLSTGTPDPALLPALGTALSQLEFDLGTSSYLDEPVVPELSAALQEQWPFPPEAFTVVDGAQDALDRLIGAVVRFGDRVIVEDPTFPPLLDLLDLAGATTLGVGVDDAGLRPDALAEALRDEPAAVFLQPRSHNPTGASLSAERADTIAELVRGTPTLVIEDDHSGDVAGAELHSIGSRLPQQTVHIRSFSKSHGPDLRLAAVGGAAAPIEALVRRRQLGPSWTSRLLQRVLLDLLGDDRVRQDIAAAERSYAERRGRLIAALRKRGMAIPMSGSGLNLWVPVRDERDAVVALAAQGIGVAPGSPFEVDTPEEHHVRVTISALAADITDLADALTRASQAHGRRSAGV